MGTRASNPAKLGNVEFDAVTSMTESLTAESPEYTTESGYTCSDHKIIKATQLTVQGKIANRPVTWADRHTPSNSRIADGRRQLLELFRSKQLVSYIQNGVTWNNMSVDGLELPDNEDDGDVLNFTVKLKQITVTQTETTLIVISFPRGGTTNANTGSASTAKTSKTATSAKSSASSQSTGSSTTASTKSNSSILYNAGKTLGLF